MIVIIFSFDFFLLNFFFFFYIFGGIYQNFSRHFFSNKLSFSPSLSLSSCSFLF